MGEGQGEAGPQREDFEMTAPLTGACLCGRVRFVVTAALPGPDACHCVQCRKQSSHYFVSTNVPRAAIAIEGDRIAAIGPSADVLAKRMSQCRARMKPQPKAAPLTA